MERNWWRYCALSGGKKKYRKSGASPLTLMRPYIILSFYDPGCFISVATCKCPGLGKSTVDSRCCVCLLSFYSMCGVSGCWMWHWCVAEVTPLASQMFVPADEEQRPRWCPSSPKQLFRTPSLLLTVCKTTSTHQVSQEIKTSTLS